MASDRRPIAGDFMAAIEIQSEKHWHELRAKHVGGSEVAALFGLHPYLTKFALWHMKKGDLPQADLSDNEKVQAGIFLEPAVAAWACDRMGWTFHKRNVYLSQNGLGGTPDYFISSKGRPDEGILEIKTTGDTSDEIPIRWELQLQQYLGLASISWGALAILRRGQNLEIVQREFRQNSVGRLQIAAAEFWESIEANKEPSPDFEADSKTISALYREANAGFEDMTGDNYLQSLCADYRDAATMKSTADKRCDAVKAEILTKIGSHAKIKCGPYTISAGEVAAMPPKMIGRAAYRGFRITEKE